MDNPFRKPYTPRKGAPIRARRFAKILAYVPEVVPKYPPKEGRDYALNGNKFKELRQENIRRAKQRSFR